MTGFSCSEDRRRSCAGEVRNAANTTSHEPAMSVATTLDGLTAMGKGSAGEVEALITCHAAREVREGERSAGNLLRGGGRLGTGTPTLLSAMAAESVRVAPRSR
jgi:hypothetical protein